MQFLSFMGLPSRRSAAGDGLADDTVSEIAARIFAELKTLNERRHSRLVRVFLPRLLDHTTTWADPWRQRVGTWARDQGVVFLDPVAALKRESPLEVPPMFMKDNPGKHFTRRGNSWVATQLRPLVQE